MENKPLETITITCEDCGAQVERPQYPAEYMRIVFYRMQHRKCDPCRRQWETGALGRLSGTLAILSQIADTNMTNKEKLLARLETISPELRSEINYHLNDIDRSDWEEEYTLLDAFRDAAEQIENNKDIDKKLWGEVKRIYVDIGAATVRDPNTITVGGSGKKYWFKMNGVEYDFSHGGGWEGFLEK